MNKRKLFFYFILAAFLITVPWPPPPTRAQVCAEIGVDVTVTDNPVSAAASGNGDRDDDVYLDDNTDNTNCFPTFIKIKDVDDGGEWAQCRVYLKDMGVGNPKKWYIQAEAKDGGENNQYVKCTARCFSFGYKQSP